jgi:hypothetical protein
MGLGVMKDNEFELIIIIIVAITLIDIMAIVLLLLLRNDPSLTIKS